RRGPCHGRAPARGAARRVGDGTWPRLHRRPQPQAGDRPGPGYAAAVTSSRHTLEPGREESLDGKPVDDALGVRRGSVGVTLKDVARVAGVHPATVSRALDPGKMWLVRRETRAKVQSVAKELGYRGDVVARSLRRGQTTTLGVIVADLGNSFLAPVLRGIAGELEKHGFMALISETQDDHARLRASIENL